MATLKEISEKSGVSINAVSRILNGQNKENRPSSRDRAAHVRKIARELGYRANVAAQAMRSGDFKTILLLKSNVASISEVDDQAMLAIQEVLAPLGYRLMLEVLPARDVAEKEFSSFLNKHCVDGVLIAINRQIPPWLSELLDALDVPKVWVGSRHNNDCVRHDDYQAAFDATKRLIDLGHQRVLYADLPFSADARDTWHFSVADRCNGYRDAMQSVDLEPLEVRPQHALSEKEGVAYVCSEVFPLKPSAVISYGLWFTGRSLLYAAAQMNIRVPEDLSLLTWFENDCHEAGFAHTGFRPQKSLIWKTAAEMVLKKIEKPALLEPQVYPFVFEAGESIAQK